MQDQEEILREKRVAALYRKHKLLDMKMSGPLRPREEREMIALDKQIELLEAQIATFKPETYGFGEINGMQQRLKDAAESLVRKAVFDNNVGNKMRSPVSLLGATASAMSLRTGSLRRRRKSDVASHEETQEIIKEAIERETWHSGLTKPVDSHSRGVTVSEGKLDSLSVRRLLSTIRPAMDEALKEELKFPSIEGDISVDKAIDRIETIRAALQARSWPNKPDERSFKSGIAEWESKLSSDEKAFVKELHDKLDRKEIELSEYFILINEFVAKVETSRNEAKDQSND